jgi:hypothetical protein
MVTVEMPSEVVHFVRFCMRRLRFCMRRLGFPDVAGAISIVLSRWHNHVYVALVLATSSCQLCCCIHSGTAQAYWPAVPGAVSFVKW